MLQFVNCGPSGLYNILAQQEYEGRLAEYNRQQWLALAEQQRQRQESAKKQAIFAELVRQQALQQEALQQEALRQEALRQEALRQEALRREAVRQEALRQEALRREAVRREQQARREAAKREAARRVYLRELERQQELERQLQLQREQQEKERVEAIEKSKQQQQQSDKAQKYRVMSGFPYYPGYYLVPIDDDEAEAVEIKTYGQDSEESTAQAESAPTVDQTQGEVEMTDDNDEMYSQPGTPSEDEFEQMYSSDELLEAAVQSLQNLETGKSEEPQQVAEETETQEKPAEQSTSETESEQEPTKEEAIARLGAIQQEVEKHIETYQRIFNNESGSSTDSDSSASPSALSSRVKVLQKAQLKLEQLYTELDGLKVPKSHRKIRHDLTSRSVAFADKIEDLIRVIEDERRSAKLADENQSEARQQSEGTLSDSDQSEKSKKSKSAHTDKPIRKVIIESVDDDSEDF